VRLSVENAVIEFGEAKSRLLAAELVATARAGAPFDAVGAAQKIKAAGDDPVDFSPAEEFAVLRALDNLRNGGRLDGAQALPRLRDALITHLATPTVEYDLLLIRDLTWEARFVSYSGRFDVGDRLLTTDGTWTVRELEQRRGRPDVLTCTPYEARK
jgi:hypothetical protein